MGGMPGGRSATNRAGIISHGTGGRGTGREMGPPTASAMAARSDWQVSRRAISVRTSPGRLCKEAIGGSRQARRRRRGWGRSGEEFFQFLEEAGQDLGTTARLLIRCRRAAERHHHRQRVVARYLVISRGELCLVVRYTIDDPRVPRRWRDVGGATRLTIYRRVTEEGVTTWTPLPGDELTGRLVFVGRGCSRSMDLDHLPSSMRNLREGIHYLDDRDARDMSIIRAEDPDQRRYRRDNHCAFGWPPLDHHLYVGRTEYPSSYSPPMWCLP